MTPVIALAQLLVTTLNEVTGKTFTRAYVPEFDKEKVEDGKWFVAAAGDDIQTKSRDADINEVEIDVCYERALPEATAEYPDPLLNLPFIDECMEEVESVKTLFRQDGAMKNRTYPYTFLKMKNTPLYVPEYLYAEGIFVSSIRLTFFANLETADFDE